MLTHRLLVIVLSFAWVSISLSSSSSGQEIIKFFDRHLSNAADPHVNGMGVAGHLP
jgi:hypothetical protein